jgi:2-phosphosulfolactate phosphatase
MPTPRPVHVHLTPALVATRRLAGGVAVVLDVLRATTTIVHAVAADCVAVRPCATVEEARALAGAGVLLAGERGGVPLPGFDLGNSPGEFTAERCAGKMVVLTTTNGTKALLHAAAAVRVLVAAFVNRGAVCEQLRRERRPVHILCAGEAGGASLEDTLLAGALVDALASDGDTSLDDGAQLARACFVQLGTDLEAALRLGAGGVCLASLGYDEDIRAAARVDRFAVVPELRRDPLRIEAGAG